MANLTNALGILVGISGWLPPATAGLLHIGHTLGIMVNSSRLLNWEPRNGGLRRDDPQCDLSGKGFAVSRTSHARPFR
jgi:hypothetical protein